MGLYQQVVAAVNASTDVKVKIVFNNAQVFTENDPFVLEITTALNQSTDQIHALFVLAQGMQP
jgi:hypothetical protein